MPDFARPTADKGSRNDQTQELELARPAEPFPRKPSGLKSPGRATQHRRSVQWGRSVKPAANDGPASGPFGADPATSARSARCSS
jgi:hypothetical protein